MHRFRRYTRTMLAILLVFMLVLLGTLYAVSSTLARSATRRQAESEVEACARIGAALLSQGRTAAELETALNPELNPGGVAVILLDQDGRLVAATDGAADWLGEADVSAAGEEIREISGPRGMLVMALRTADGVTLAGMPLADSNRAAFSFRALLRMYALIALGLTVLMVLLLGWRIMQPVYALVDAAERISEGEEVSVSEKLPMELRPLGRAFNRMSRRLSESIHELTRERDTLSQVLEGLDEGVLAVDQAGDVLRQNSAALRLLGGMESPAYTRVMTALRAASAGGAEDMTWQEGERTMLAIFRPLAGGALAVLRDVTERERLERTSREYVANISHELRTPLSSMRGITEGLRDGLVEDEQERQRYYELLLGEVKRLSRLVNDLLELGKLQSSPAAFALERVDMAETLYELHARTRALAREKGVKLTLDVPETPLPPVQTNEDRLQQVLTIFLDNAIKFTPAGGEVTLGALRQASYVRVFVRDTGIGMDEYTARHAFDRFHQADPSHGSKGSGLGLAIAHEIMQRLGGRITVRSKEGEGSEFSFLVKAEEA